MDCGHNHCGACCGGELRLTQAEIDVLLRFAQIPFFPVARRADSELPVCLEIEGYPVDELGGVIAALHEKRLIRLDYGLPLTNYDYAAYQAYSVRGSMALTATGQDVVEQLEIQGFET